MAEPKSLEIFKPGRHAAMSGQVLSFSEADLEASARAYNPALHEAPIVAGHPRTDAPAYGWVKSLRFADSRLLAEPHQVDPAFADLVREGRFKKLSASFYIPGSPNNPVPGVYYLRHIGFLGAMPPAVKGLKSVAFADPEEGVVAFGEWSDRVSARLWRGLRDWFIGKFGIEEADRVIPGFSVEDLEEAAAMPPEGSGQPSMPGFSEGGAGAEGDRNPSFNGADPAPPPDQRFRRVSARGSDVGAPIPTGCGRTEEPGQREGRTEKSGKENQKMTAEELAAREAALTQKETEFAEREAKLKRAEADARHAGHAAFVEGLVKEGKMLPAEKDSTVAILDFAADIEGRTVEFGETSLSPLEAVKAHLAARPKAIEYAEVATQACDPGKGGASEKLEALTREKMKAKPDLSFAVAFAEVQTEHPHLALEYADNISACALSLVGR